MNSIIDRQAHKFLNNVLLYNILRDGAFIHRLNGAFINENVWKIKKKIRRNIDSGIINYGLSNSHIYSTTQLDTEKFDIPNQSMHSLSIIAK